jgi:hypothetical protein
MEHLVDLMQTIAELGRSYPSYPDLHAVEPFGSYFGDDGVLLRQNLDDRDGSCTRREMLARYLLLNAVLDQGPDIKGVRDMLVNVVNSLYRREIRIFHRPLSLFEHIGVSVNEIVEKHAGVKAIRKNIWAKENQVKNPDKYNLFMDNSTQVLGYAVYRWGVPLALSLLLEMDFGANEDMRSVALITYLQKHKSAEAMSSTLKTHPRYGLGKAIGDKACHLFAKWICSSFGLMDTVSC